ncbi:MAG: hypothetical protein QOG63_125, partial [Thermoleophilaceae bacterium]|nr:hypothetical protein [Thermoleophilaceae bacterium]
MGSARRVSLLIAVALLLVPSGAMAAKAPSPQKQAKRAFALLLLDTRSTPKRDVSKRNKAKLLKIAKHARKASRRKPCKALKLMRAYNRGLRKVRERRVPGDVPGLASFRGQLRSDMLRVNVALLQHPKAKRCGGGKASKVTQVDARVISSDATKVHLKLLLPAPKFVGQQAGGQDYEQMLMDGMGETGGVGEPGLPRVEKFVGVPVGADVSVQVNGTEGYDLPGVNLFPHQQSPVDKPVASAPGAPDEGVFANKPFSKDGNAYKSTKPFPAVPASGDAVGMMRDLRIGDVGMTGGRYTPKRKKLHVFTSLDVTVNFGGASSGKFGDPQDFENPWDVYFNRNYRKAVINFDAVSANLGDLKVNPQSFCGEEMLVITDSALQPAANTFANARRAAGIDARVVLTGAGAGQAGTTNTEIQTFIRGELNDPACSRHPSYVVLLGNTAHVPTFLVECAAGAGFHPDPAHPDAYCDIASDLPYSLNGVGSDLFADVELGRIPARDLAEANAVVNKVVNYETTPPAPSGDDFYRHATVTGFFQQRVHCVLDEGAVGPQNCNPDIGAVNGHYEPDYPNTTDERGFTKTSDTIIRAIQA